MTTGLPRTYTRATCTTSVATSSIQLTRPVHVHTSSTSTRSFAAPPNLQPTFSVPVSATKPDLSTANGLQFSQLKQNPPSDVFKHLKDIKIPTFSGDKTTYATWKAAFSVCVDKQPLSAELKLLQLRQCLSGPPLKSIEAYGYSAAAYTAALKRQDLKYGGARRQTAVHMEALHKFTTLRENKPKDLEKFADFLQVAVINLQDAGKSQELEAGTFYLHC